MFKLEIWIVELEGIYSDDQLQPNVQVVSVAYS